MLDPKLNRDQLYQIAQSSAHLDADLLDDLRYHDNAWLELQRWAQVVAGIGDPTAWPPPPAPPVEEPAPRRRWRLRPSSPATNGEATEMVRSSPRWRSSLIVAGAAVALALGGVWAVMEIAGGTQSEDTQSAAQSEGMQSGAQSGGQAALTAPLRAGYSSFECYTWGVGVSCHGLTSKEDNQPATAVDGLEETPIAALSVGRGFGAGVDPVGTVYAWGANDAGQLGTKGKNKTDLVTVGFLPRVPDQLISGAAHTCALVGGDVYCFGSNEYGQIRGVATGEPIGLTRVVGPAGVTSIGTSGYNTWALSDDGIWVWGNNKYGQSIPEDDATTVPPTLVDKAE